jgi:hypothetical protein
MPLRVAIFALALIGAIALSQQTGYSQTNESSARSAAADGQTSAYAQGSGPTAGPRTVVRLAPRTGRTGNPRANPASPVDSAATKP